MSIAYYVRQITGSGPAAGTWVGQSKARATVDIGELAGAVAARGMAASAGEVRGIIEALCEVIEDQVKQGNLVNLGGIGRFWGTIKGSFPTPSSPFDPALQRITVAASANARLRQAVASAGVEHIGVPAAGPTLVSVTDASTGLVNESLSVNSIATLRGENMVFDATQADEGLYVVDAVTPTNEFKVSIFQKTTEKEIVFNVPDVGAISEVDLVLRTRKNATAPLLEGRIDGLSIGA
jgi:hypothetical protein